MPHIPGKRLPSPWSTVAGLPTAVGLGRGAGGEAVIATERASLARYVSPQTRH
ncbi:hypothetical protein ACF1AX_36830 [Streptomyces sp. NPDC014802]|uniref:hypothetical protein n=1 Tax=Streptomyces sp. NPDC014802 TaxID=3364917 RepID=UPI0036FC0FD6